SRKDPFLCTVYLAIDEGGLKLNEHFYKNGLNLQTLPLDMKSWNNEAESCPGMNKRKLISKEIIDEWFQMQNDEKLILL
ncbi:MAG: hypothetical protein U9N32_09740, partial [Spirochaetota bacterium]|nr:hypothetical protein [Spirochaetota bacterium]